MVGFVIAVAMEVASGKSVGSQLFSEVVQKSTKVITHSVDGFALSSFAFVVLAVTMGTLAPMINDAAASSKRSVGPFTPDAELQNARVAMLGFAGLLAVEAIKRSVRETEGIPEVEALKIELEIGMPIFATEDAAEGPRAFAEKRTPDFKRR